MSVYLDGRDDLGDAGVSKWKDNIKIDVKRIGYEMVDWIHLALDKNQLLAFENRIMNLKI
jgi:hypothetical protein